MQPRTKLTISANYRKHQWVGIFTIDVLKELYNHLSWMDYRLIQFLQTGVYYIPQKFTEEIKKVTVEHFFVRYQEPPQWFIDFLKEHGIEFEIKS